MFFMILISCDANVCTHWSFMNRLSVGNEGDIALVVFYLLFAQTQPSQSSLITAQPIHAHTSTLTYTQTHACLKQSN